MALVTSTIKGSTNATAVTTDAVDTTGANGIVVIGTWIGNEAPTLTDSKGNNWTGGSTIDNAAEGRVRMWWCASPTVGSGHTFTLTGSGNIGPVLAVYAIDDANTASFLGGESAGGTNFASTIQPGSVTPSEDNAFIVAGTVGYGTMNAGFEDQAIDTNVSNPPFWFAHTSGWLKQSAAAAVNPTFTFGGDTWSAAIQTWFKTIPFIAVTDFDDKQVFQRDKDGSEAKTITVSGTYAGTAPTTIEAIVYEDGTTTPVQTWTALTNATIGGGAWSGSLNVPQGGWYNFAARSKDGGGSVMHTSAQTGNKVGVGIGIAWLGQSNGVYMFTPTGLGTAANTKTSVFNGGGWAGFATNDNDGAIAASDKIQDESGLPVFLIEAPVSGVGLTAGVFDNWLDTGGDAWTDFLDLLEGAGGDVELVIFQGLEADAYYDVAKDTIKSGLDTIYSRLQAAIGRNAAQLKFGATILGSIDETDYEDLGAQNAIEAVIEWTQQTSGAFCAGVSRDLATTDGLHLTPASCLTMGLRIGQAIAHQLGDAEFGSAGPRIVSSSWTPGTATITLTAQLDGGTELDATDPTGFEVMDDEGGWTRAIDQITVSGNTVVIDLTEPSTDPNMRVRYQYGTLPDTTTPVYDDASFGDGLGMPLWPLPSMLANHQQYPASTWPYADYPYSGWPFAGWPPQTRP